MTVKLLLNFDLQMPNMVAFDLIRFNVKTIQYCVLLITYLMMTTLLMPNHVYKTFLFQICTLIYKYIISILEEGGQTPFNPHFKK